MLKQLCNNLFHHSKYLTVGIMLQWHKGDIPKIFKKSSQKLFASASSLTSFSHYLLKTVALLLISFQLKGILVCGYLT